MGELIRRYAKKGMHLFCLGLEEMFVCVGSGLMFCEPGISS